MKGSLINKLKMKSVSLDRNQYCFPPCPQNELEQCHPLLSFELKAALLLLSSIREKIPPLPSKFEFETALANSVAFSDDIT